MPRKSTASLAESTLSVPTTSNGDAPPADVGDSSILSGAVETPTTTKSKASKKDKDEQDFGVEDLLLPRTLTSRLAKGILPANTSIQKDALLALTKAATVFVSYLASNANEQTTKKTVGPQDVLKALQEIEMDGVMGLGETGKDGKLGGRLERELELYEEGLRGKRKGYREKLKARESGVSAAASNGGPEEVEEEEEEKERDTKRPRVSATGDGRSSPATTKASSSRATNGTPAASKGTPRAAANGTVSSAKINTRESDTLSDLEDSAEEATGEIDGEAEAEAGGEIEEVDETEEEDPEAEEDEEGSDENENENEEEESGDDSGGDKELDGPERQLRGEGYGVDDADEDEEDDSD